MKRALPDHQAYFDPTSVLRDFMQLTRISSLIEDKVILELVPEREGSPLTLLEILVLRRVTPGSPAKVAALQNELLWSLTETQTDCYRQPRNSKSGSRVK